MWMALSKSPKNTPKKYNLLKIERALNPKYKPGEGRFLHLAYRTPFPVS